MTFRAILGSVLACMVFCRPVSASSASTRPGGSGTVILVSMSVERTPWFSGQWRWWHNGNHHPDNKDASGRRDICSHVFYPTIGLYDAADPDYVEYHCQTAKMIGVDVLSIAAYPRDEWVDRMFAAYARYLPMYGLAATTRVQKNVPFDQLDHYLSVFGPATFRIDGRPVLTFFQPPGEDEKAIRDWKNRHAEADRPFLIKWASTTVHPRWKGIVEGAFDWAGDDASHPHHTDVKPYNRYFDFEQEQAAYRADVSRARKLLADGIITYYIDGVSPGFDNLGVNGWGKNLIKADRANGRTYEWRWQQAVQNQFPAVCIPTWDDWGENTTIQPTLEYGNQYLELTRTYTARYHHLAADTADLSLPESIYKLRKTTADAKARDALAEASDKMRSGDYVAAQRLVEPLWAASHLTDARYFEPREAAASLAKPPSDR